MNICSDETVKIRVIFVVYNSDYYLLDNVSRSYMSFTEIILDILLDWCA